MKRTLSFLLCAALLPAAALAENKPAHWSYDGATGPQNWGKLEQDFSTCKLGHNQSPIDIRKTSKAQLPPLEFAYSPSPLKILDNGHTIQVNYAAGSSVTIEGKRYDLLQFHFHKPSEEKINGRSYPMVAHLVHKNEEGKLAVVAVLFRKGAENPLVQTLWDSPAKGKRRSTGSARRQHRHRQAAARHARLLQFRRVADHSAVQRRGQLVRAENAG